MSLPFYQQQRREKVRKEDGFQIDTYSIYRSHFEISNKSKTLEGAREGDFFFIGIGFIFVAIKVERQTCLNQAWTRSGPV